MKKINISTQAVLILLFVFLSLMIIIPFVMIMSASFSVENEIAKFGYGIFPKGMTFDAYRFVFKNPTMIFNAYGVTATFSAITMVLGTLLMAMVAYPLSKKNLKGRRKLSFYLYFTMLFNGGLVPSYILITQYLHLNNSLLVYIIPCLINIWQVFVLRAFFQGLPEELSESCMIDGAGEFAIFFKIVLPLSKPAIATIALQVFLGKWNDWQNSMLYIDSEKLYSLQYMLQRIMQNISLLENDNMNSTMISAINIPGETARMAMAVVVAGPALFIFPFFQKYFVRGLTVGSVKG